MTSIVYYRQGADLPSPAVTWTDDLDGLIDFSSGWSFTLKVGFPGRDAVLTKTAGITGASTDPNVTISWSPDELGPVTPGAWPAELHAHNSSTNKDRIKEFILRIHQATT